MMVGFRVLAYALLAYSAFWVTAYRGLWYDSHVFARKSPAFEFQVGDFFVSGARSQTGFLLSRVQKKWCERCVHTQNTERDRQLQTAKGEGMSIPCSDLYHIILAVYCI